MRRWGQLHAPVSHQSAKLRLLLWDCHVSRVPHERECLQLSSYSFLLTVTAHAGWRAGQLLGNRAYYKPSAADFRFLYKTNSTPDKCVRFSYDDNDHKK